MVTPVMVDVCAQSLTFVSSVASKTSKRQFGKREPLLQRGAAPVTYQEDLPCGCFIQQG